MKDFGQLIARGSLAVLLLSSVAACSGRSSGGFVVGDAVGVGDGSGSNGSGSGGNGSGNGGGGSGSADSGGNGGTGGNGNGGGPIATGPQGPAGPTGPQGPAGPQGPTGPAGTATLLGGALGGTASVNAGGLQVGGTGANGTAGTVAASVLGPTAAPNAPVSASVLSGPGNQVQGLLTGVTTVASSPTTLGNSILATTQPLLGTAGTLPLVSQVTGGLLPNAPPGSVPLVGATLGQTAILGNGQTPVLANAAVISPTAAAGSPITANVLSGGSGGALAGATGGGGVLGGVTNLVGGVTGAVAGAPASGGGAVTNTVNNATAARPVQGLVGGALNTVGGVLGGVTGGLGRR